MNEVWATATLRAIASAVIVGALGFLSVWASTDDIKTLVTAGLVPALTVLGTRLGIEGLIDARKVEKAGKAGKAGGGGL